MVTYSSSCWWLSAIPKGDPIPTPGGSPKGWAGTKHLVLPDLTSKMALFCHTGCQSLPQWPPRPRVGETRPGSTDTPGSHEPGALQHRCASGLYLPVPKLPTTRRGGALGSSTAASDTSLCLGHETALPTAPQKPVSWSLGLWDAGPCSFKSQTPLFGFVWIWC